MAHKCMICDLDGDKVTIMDETGGGHPEYRNYCGRLHALIHLFTVYSNEIKAGSKASTIRVCATAGAILGKLSKAVEKEWKATSKTKAA